MAVLMVVSLVGGSVAVSDDLTASEKVVTMGKVKVLLWEERKELWRDRLWELRRVELLAEL